MPISFIFAIIFAVAGLIVVALAAIAYEGGEHEVEVESRYGGRIRTETRNDPSKRIVIAGLIFFFGTLVGLLTFSASATNIPTRTVGVEVSFGKPLPTPLQNGFHMVAPWHHVERFKTSAQFLEETGDKAVTVRLANQTTARVDIRRSQWNIDPKGDVVDLFKTYKDFDRIQNTVVVGSEQSALTEEFQQFDPLAGITGTADKPATGLTVDQVSSRALDRIRTTLGSGITVTNLQIFVHYDDVTQSKLNDYAVALAGTRIAVQNAATATQIALGNKALAEQASTNSPGVQYQNCLSMIERLAARNQLGQLPLAFTCVPPGSGSTQNPVLIQPKK